MVHAELVLLRALRNDGASGELGNGRGDDEKSENKLGRTWVDEQSSECDVVASRVGRRMLLHLQTRPPDHPWSYRFDLVVRFDLAAFQESGALRGLSSKRGRKSKRQRETDLSWFRHVLLFLLLLFSPLLLLFPRRVEYQRVPEQAKTQTSRRADPAEHGELLPVRA